MCYNSPLAQITLSVGSNPTYDRADIASRYLLDVGHMNLLGSPGVEQ